MGPPGASAPRGSGWTPDALAVVERACTAHGGTARWQGLDMLSVTPATFTGLLPLVTGVGRHVPLPARIEVRPHVCTTIFRGFPDTGSRGVFERGQVRIELVATGAVIDTSPNHRAVFPRAHERRRWSALDALYFFGYAWWHYHVVPFTLTDARCVSHAQRVVNGGRLDILDVEFDPGVPTHSRRQQFYIDASGLIRRHDYVAEVIGGWARAAHFWRDYRMVEGIAVATARHVVARLGRHATPVTILHATLRDIRVAFSGATP